MSTLFASHQDFSDGGGFREGKLAVHLADKVAAQRDEEEYAEATSGEADEDRLHRVRIEVEDIERRQREDGSGDNRGGCSTNSRDDDVFENR
jgi:hypothetical protein